MKVTLKIVLLFMLCIVGNSHVLSAQSNYKISDSKENDMKMSGTSTLHDWDMNARTVTGEAQFDIEEGSNNKLVALQSLTFSLVVLNMKSDNKGLDKNAYKALKTNQYKNISYKLGSAKITPDKESQYLLNTLGSLTVAGVTKEIAMDVYCHINIDGSITCKGSYKLNMTDYQVIPPSFMLGLMTTGESITLNFNMVYKKQAGL